MTPPSQAQRRRYGVVGAAVVALLAPVLVATPASASATAHEIVYTADDDNDGIYSVVLRDLASRKATTVLPADTTNEWIYDDPELSPDGTRIVLSTDRGSASGEEGIAVVNRDGTGFTRVTTPPRLTDGYALDVAASWSPNGSRLAFTRITVTGSAGNETVDTTLYTVPATGGTPVALVGAEDGYTADWSPDGSRIVFSALPAPTAENPQPDSGPITIVNADGSGGRRTVDPSAVGLMPAWSPDGRTIAYATVTARDPDRTRAEDTTQIAVVPAAGGSARVLSVTQPTAAPTVAEYPSWAPDGESIVFDLFGYSSTDAFPPGDIWAVDAAGVRAGRVFATPGDEAQANFHGPAPAPVTSGSASTYVAVPPQRVLDTREGLGAPAAKVGPAGTIDVKVTGTVPTSQGGSVTVPTGASAVVLNLTVTGTTASTDVRAYPKGTPVVGASNLNAGAGQTVPNLVTVPVGNDGSVTLRNSGGTVHLIADLAGYYIPGDAGSGFSPVEPSRILDTRDPGVGAPAGKVGPTAFVDLQVTGTALKTADGRTVAVPADARAVVLNVTATGATASTDVRVYPTPKDSEVPRVSNLNVRAHQTTPNLVTVAVGEGGKVRLRNLDGEVHLIADLAGYYAPNATGRFVPVSPTRFLDTRIGVGGAPIPVTAQGYVDLKVAGTRGVPAGATAAVMNVTGTGVTASTDVRAFPAGAAALPTVSNLNLTQGVTRANLAIVKTGVDGRVRLRNAAGELHLIGDVAGYMVG